MNMNRRLIQQASGTGWVFPLIIILGIIAGILSILQAFQVSRVVTDVFINGMNLPAVVGGLKIIFLIIILRASFTFSNDLLVGKLAIIIKSRLRDELLRKISRLGSTYVRGESSAEITTTVLQGIDSLEVYFSQFLPQVVLAATLPVIILFAVFPLDWLTGVVFLFTAPIIPLFMVLIGRASEATTRRQWTALTRLGGFFLDTLQGIATLKNLGRSRETAERIKTANEQYGDLTMTVLRKTFLSALVLELVATIATAVVAVEVGLRLLSSRIEFQQAFFILLIAPEFYVPMRNLSARYHAAMTGVTAAKRIFEILDVPERESIIRLKERREDMPFQGEFVLSIRDLWIRFPENKIHSLQGVNLELQGGKQYALVGKSGSGKSTLARVLMRLMEPDEGKITLNGIDMHQWTGETWRMGIAWVPQNPAMFNSTIIQNVTLGDPRFSRQEVEKALEAAALLAMTKNLPMGLDTPVGECGARLSGGEIQRIALARGFLQDPGLLILDEPSSSLDPRNEKLILESVGRLRKGRTTLTIAHRFSTLTEVDEIIHLEEGKIDGQGSHSRLMQDCQGYWELFSFGKGLE